MFGVQEVSPKQTVEKLWTIASELVAEKGEHAQLDFSVRTTEGRFQIQSYPDESVKDLVARIAYIALMPGHGGLEEASVRTVRNNASTYTGKTCCEMSRTSSISTCVGGSSCNISSFETDSNCNSYTQSIMHSDDRRETRFSEDVEQIFFTAEQDGDGQRDVPKVNDAYIALRAASYPSPTILF